MLSGSCYVSFEAQHSKRKRKLAGPFVKCRPHESCVDVASFTDFVVSMEEPTVTLPEHPGSSSGYVDLTVVRTGDLACRAEVICFTTAGTVPCCPSLSHTRRFMALALTVLCDGCPTRERSE